MVAIVDVVTELGRVGLWLQAIGGIVVLWIIFQFIALRYTLKRMKEIDVIKIDMVRIEKKIDRLLNKK